MDGVYYAIESLRIDGDYSADPDDYQDRPLDEPVGRVLHAFLRVYLPTELLPESLATGQGPRTSWPLPEAFEIARDPTRRDLLRWRTARGLTLTCRGATLVWS